MTQSRTTRTRPAAAPEPHRRMGERAVSAIAESPWFKVFSFVTQIAIAIIVSLSAFIFTDIIGDIAEIKATVNVYNAEKLAYEQRIKAIEDFAKESMVFRQRFLQVEAREAQRDREVAELRAWSRSTGRSN